MSAPSLPDFERTLKLSHGNLDAAELAAEEAAVAVYQVEVLPEGEGELGEVYVRFRDADSGEMVERSWTAPYDAHAPTFDRASPQVQLAGTAALVAEALRGDPIGEKVWMDDLAGAVRAKGGTSLKERRDPVVDREAIRAMGCDPDLVLRMSGVRDLADYKRLKAEMEGAA